MPAFAHRSGHKLSREMMQILQGFWICGLLRERFSPGPLNRMLEPLYEWQWGSDGKHASVNPNAWYMFTYDSCSRVWRRQDAVGTASSSCAQPSHVHLWAIELFFEICAFLLTQWKIVVCPCEAAISVSPCSVKTQTNEAVNPQRSSGWKEYTVPLRSILHSPWEICQLWKKKVQQPLWYVHLPEKCRKTRWNE